MSDNYRQKFSIIKHRGSPNEAMTIWGWTAIRQKSLFVAEPYFAMIPCLAYDNHFIYEVPEEYINVPSYMCTCGSMAVVVGNLSYRKDATPEGLVIACYFRNVLRNDENGDPWGKHADGST